MKAKVLIAFFDKEAKKSRKPGETFDVTHTRFNEITKSGRYIEAYAEQKKTAVENEAEDKN